MKNIGFIGVGIMGKAMVRNLMKAGHEVHIYARTPSKVQDVVSEGAVLHGSIAEAVKDRDVVISIVGGPADVEQIYLGSQGIVENAKKGAYLLDMTTSSPQLAVKLHELGKEKGLHVMDIPVTGGDKGARDGTLSLLVGGDKDDMEAVMDVLSVLGNNINYEGPAGCGQHTKSVNQIMVAGAVAGMCEGFAYAKANGLDLATVLKSVATGAAGSKSLDLYADRIVEGDLQPGGYVKFLVKDLNIAKHGAEDSGINLVIMNSILSQFQNMIDKGMGDLGIHALGELYKKHK